MQDVWLILNLDNINLKNRTTYTSIFIIKFKIKMLWNQTWANNLTANCYSSKTCLLTYNLCMNRWQIVDQNSARAWFKLS